MGNGQEDSQFKLWFKHAMLATGMRALFGLYNAKAAVQVSLHF